MNVKRDYCEELPEHIMEWIWCFLLNYLFAPWKTQRVSNIISDYCLKFKKSSKLWSDETLLMFFIQFSGEGGKSFQSSRNFHQKYLSDNNDYTSHHRSDRKSITHCCSSSKVFPRITLRNGFEQFQQSNAVMMSMNEAIAFVFLILRDICRVTLIVSVHQEFYTFFC